MASSGRRYMPSIADGGDGKNHNRVATESALVVDILNRQVLGLLARQDYVSDHWRLDDGGVFIQRVFGDESSCASARLLEGRSARLSPARGLHNERERTDLYDIAWLQDRAGDSSSIDDHAIRGRHVGEDVDPAAALDDRVLA